MTYYNETPLYTQLKYVKFRNCASYDKKMIFDDMPE